MMEAEWKKVQKAALSDCRSLGSNQYPSDRFPKVSIGITVEKHPKTGPGMMVEDGCAMPVSERRFSQEKAPNENKSCVMVENIMETKDQKASLWFSTRSVHYETPTTETVHVIGNQASVLQSEDHICKKADTVSFRKAREKGENSERVEEVAFTSVQEINVPDKGLYGEQPSGMTKHDNKALRVKLWEILGNASQTKQTVNSQDFKDTRTSDQPKCPIGRLPKAKHCSDPIETDSESPNQVERRPVTRSSTRKKAPPVTQKMQSKTPHGKKPLSSFSSASKQKLEEKNSFTFQDGEREAGSLGKTANGPSSSFKGKRIEHKKAKVEPRRIHFPRKLASEKSFQNIEREETKSSHDKTSSQSKEKGCSLSFPCQSEKDNLQMSKEVSNTRIHPKGETLEQLNGSPLTCAAGAHDCAFSPSPTKQTHSREHEMSPCLRNDAPWQKASSPLMARYRNSPDDFQSPTFAMNANASSQRSKRGGEVSYSPRLPKSLDSSQSGSYASDEDTESSDDIRGTHVSQESIEEKEAEKQPSLSPVEDQENHTFEANESFKKGHRRSSHWFSDGDSPYRSNAMLHHTKRVHSLKDETTRKTNLSSPSPTGARETTGSDKASEQFPENSLARAVYQLAVVLERFKTKIKSQTSKKSSEILSAVAEKIQLQLQDAESQMQADVGKLISTGKSKRRRIESKLQEQEENLRILHDKFKEDVNQHLLVCKTMLEEIEAHQIDLKGNADKQKASHRKFLLHVEESVEAQLSNAETKIADIHKEARKRMNGLKLVLKEWMAEGASGQQKKSPYA